MYLNKKFRSYKELKHSGHRLMFYSTVTGFDLHSPLCRFWSCSRCEVLCVSAERPLVTSSDPALFSAAARRHATSWKPANTRNQRPVSSELKPQKNAEHQPFLWQHPVSFTVKMSSCSWWMQLVCPHLNPALHSWKVFGFDQFMELDHRGNHRLVIFCLLHMKTWRLQKMIF